MIIKKIVFNVYNFYHKYFPYLKGKHLIARILDKICKSFIIKSKSGIYLEIFLSSSQDLHLINLENNLSNRKNFNLTDIDFLISELDKNSIFIDIGANIGYYSLIAANQNKECMVYSFEPSIREYKRFLNGIIFNNIKNIVPFNLALSDRNTIQKFYTSNFHTGLNSLNLNVQESTSESFVPTLTFDNIFINLNIKKIDLIKIDVEGAEFLVLKGMRKFLDERRISKIIIEITPDFLLKFGHTKNDIYDLLYSCGYKAKYNLTEWQYDEVFTLL
jgi:FkbM family methyltransferase